jgi:hypothetical protein
MFVVERADDDRPDEAAEDEELGSTTARVDQQRLLRVVIACLGGGVHVMLLRDVVWCLT